MYAQETNDTLVMYNYVYCHKYLFDNDILVMNNYVYCHKYLLDNLYIYYV